MELEKLASIFEACKVLPLRPSDVLVFRANCYLPDLTSRLEIHKALEEATGHARILILDGGADLAVVRPEEEPVSREDLDAIEETRRLLEDSTKPQHRPIAPGCGVRRDPAGG